MFIPIIVRRVEHVYGYDGRFLVLPKVFSYLLTPHLNSPFRWGRSRRSQMQALQSLQHPSASLSVHSLREVHCIGTDLARDRSANWKLALIFSRVAATYIFQCYSFMIPPTIISNLRLFIAVIDPDTLGRTSSGIAVVEVERCEHHRGGRGVHQRVGDVS
jgi:hypothetical protein